MERLEKALESEFHPNIQRDLKLLKTLTSCNYPLIEVVENVDDYGENLKVFEKYTEIEDKVNIDYEKLQDNLFCRADALKACESPIISSNDSIAYSAIIQFYMQNYSECLSILSTLHKMLAVDEQMKFAPEKKAAATGRSSVMTVDECEYNMILCKLLLKRYNELTEDIDALIGMADEEFAHWLILVKSVLRRSLGIDIAGESAEALNLEELKGAEDVEGTKQIQIDFKVNRDAVTDQFPFVEVLLGSYKLVLFLILNRWSNRALVGR